MVFLLHDLVSNIPEYMDLLSTVVDPHSLQLLRCCNKAFAVTTRHKEQCIASAEARYKRIMLLCGDDDGDFFRLNSMYGCRHINIHTVHSDSDIDGLVCTYSMVSTSYRVHGDLVNVVVEYDKRRFLGYMTGGFDSVRDFDVLDLGPDVFCVYSQWSLVPGAHKIWFSMLDIEDEGDCISLRIHLDAGGTIGEVFADYFFYSV